MASIQSRPWSVRDRRCDTARPIGRYVSMPTRASPKTVTTKLEAEAHDFVRRYAAALGLDPDQVWRDRREALLTLGETWFETQRKQQERDAADYLAAQRRGRNSTPAIQWPGVELQPAPEPTYRSLTDYILRTTYAKRMARCHAAAKKANQKRLLSDAPTFHLTGADVWTILKAARGRCAYCGSLAVETRPSKANGAPTAWAQVGRRLGSLEHRRWRAGGGDNDLTNLAWSCLWCNTWKRERRPGVADHGGFYPPPDDDAAIDAAIRMTP